MSTYNCTVLRFRMRGKLGDLLWKINNQKIEKEDKKKHHNLRRKGKPPPTAFAPLMLEAEEGPEETCTAADAIPFGVFVSGRKWGWQSVPRARCFIFPFVRAVCLGLVVASWLMSIGPSSSLQSSTSSAHSGVSLSAIVSDFPIVLNRGACLRFLRTTCGLVSKSTRVRLNSSSLLESDSIVSTADSAVIDREIFSSTPWSKSTTPPP